MTVLHSGATKEYSENWSKAFGKATWQKRTNGAPKTLKSGSRGKKSSPKKRAAAPRKVGKKAKGKKK